VKPVNIYDAKSRFSELVDKAASGELLEATAASGFL